MRVAHLLRKYNPREWGGTETAVKRLLDGLKPSGVSSTIFAPAVSSNLSPTDPLGAAGHEMRRYHSFVPVWGISEEQRRQLVSVGGNIMSLDLVWKLWREPRLSVIHTHTLNRLGGIALKVAQSRKLPLVATIHGGVLDLPASVKENLLKPLEGGVEWGKVFGWILKSRQVLALADAVITCNKKEASLLAERHPGKRLLVQPHGVPARVYDRNYQEEARKAFPEICGKRVLLAVGRIDPVKNQSWLVEQLPAILQKYPDVLLVLAGPCTDESYGKLLKKEIRRWGLDNHVLRTGGLPPEDPRLIGLLQEASVLALPSLSETFGLIILEAWACGTPVIATRTSGALELVRDRENGWLFDLAKPEEFHAAIDEAFRRPELLEQFGRAGWQQVSREFDTEILVKRVHQLYAELIEAKRCR